MAAYRELSVRIICNEKESSGSIMHIDEEESSIFIVTARHCIEDAGANYDNLQILDYQNTKIDVIGKPYFPEDGAVDIAFIQAKLCKQYPFVLLGVPSRNQEIFCYGYPGILNEYQSEGELINGKINDILIDKGLIKLSMTHQLATFDNDEYANIEGYSGSALYYEEEEVLFLLGMLIEIRGQGQQNGINAIHIDQIKKFAKELLSIELIPFSLKSFQSYFNEICMEQAEDEQKNKYLPLLDKTYEKIKDYSPFDIIQQYSSENVLVISDNKKYNHTEKQLWISWLRLILYKAMQLNNDFEVKKIIGRDEKPKTHMVFTNQEKRRHFIKQLIESPFFDEIESSDTIFVSNNKNGFQEKKQIITKEEIMGIVDKIDEPNVTTEFYIDKKTPKLKIQKRFDI